MRLHLLDATYELFRAYFGFPKRQAPDGTEVGGTLGIIETTLALLRDPDVTHVGAATDHVIESYRNGLYPGYKTSAGMEPELLGQFPLAERALEALGLTVWPMVEFEADDAIASAAFQFADDVDQVIILTPDKDMAQCVIGQHVVMYDRRREILFDEQGVHDKWGVAPESIPDYLALVGDSADGFPGVPSWGAKSASTVLAHYMKLERIPPDPEDWQVTVRGARRLGENLAAHREDAFLFRTLATLQRDVAVGTLDDLEWKGVPRELFEALCDELGFDDVKTRPHRWA